MACELTKTYGTKQPTQRAASAIARTIYEVCSEQWLDDQPRRLVAGGMTCEEALAFLKVQIPIWLGASAQRRTIVKALSTMPACGGLVYSGSPQDGGNWQAWPFEGFENVGVGYSDGSSCFTDDLNGNPTGANYPTDGSWDRLAFWANWHLTIYTTWLPNLQAVTAIADIDAWFYCVMPACVAPVAPPPSWAGGPGGFLIPRDSSPDPVEQNASVPPLNSLLKLSNHTFQFIRNFGRIPK